MIKINIPLSKNVGHELAFAQLEQQKSRFGFDYKAFISVSEWATVTNEYIVAEIFIKEDQDEGIIVSICQKIAENLDIISIPLKIISEKIGKTNILVNKSGLILPSKVDNFIE